MKLTREFDGATGGGRQIALSRAEDAAVPKAVNDYTTTAGGTRMATSVAGVLTGRGADVIIIDDPLKPDQALSEVGRKTVNEWYDNTLLSRLNNKSSGIIIVMQRLHQDDLVGHVLAQDDWTVLSFPAIAEEPERVPFATPFGPRLFVRQPGAALHPERESIHEYELMRRRIGLYNFSSQYQQRPIPVSGNLVKREWLRFYNPEELPRRFLRTVQSWDTASKTSELNDYSVCTTWGADLQNYYLIDVFRARLNYPDLKRAIIAQLEKFRPREIVIEDKSSGTQLIQDLTNELTLDFVGYKRRPAQTKSCACMPAATGSRTAASYCRPMPRGSMNTSWSLSAFRAPDTTTRSTQPLRRWIICGRTTSSRPTSRRTAADSAGSGTKFPQNLARPRRVRWWITISFCPPPVPDAIIRHTSVALHPFHAQLSWIINRDPSSELISGNR
jgi:phage terminase large subunit-like protein